MNSDVNLIFDFERILALVIMYLLIWFIDKFRPKKMIVKVVNNIIKLSTAFYILDTIVYILENNSPIQMLVSSRFDETDFDNFMIIEFGCVGAMGVILGIILVVSAFIGISRDTDKDIQLNEERMNKVLNIVKNVCSKLFFTFEIYVVLTIFHGIVTLLINV